jgi:hypothetical protein
LQTPEPDVGIRDVAISPDGRHLAAVNNEVGAGHDGCVKAGVVVKWVMLDVYSMVVVYMCSGVARARVAS